jgi:hypothetical protein
MECHNTDDCSLNYLFNKNLESLSHLLQTSVQLYRHLKNAVFSDVSPCVFILNRRFGGTCHFHLRLEEITHSRMSIRQLLTSLLATLARGISSALKM